jgi:hypothetical protein
MTLNVEPNRGVVAMKKKQPLWLILSALLISFSVSAQAKTIAIATSGVTLTNTPIWVGINKKYFDDVGLSVQFVVMRSDLGGEDHQNRVVLTRTCIQRS